MVMRKIVIASMLVGAMLAPMGASAAFWHKKKKPETTETPKPDSDYKQLTGRRPRASG